MIHLIPSVRSITAVLLSFITTLTIQAQPSCDCSKTAGLTKSAINDSTVGITLLRSGERACIAKGNELMGKFYVGLNMADSAERFLKIAELQYHQSGCPESAIIYTYKFLAQVYYTRNDFAKAQEYSLKLLQSAETSQNIFEQVGAYTMIAQLFNQTNQAGKGITYTQKAAALLPQIKDTAERLQLLNLVAKRFLWHYQDTKSNSGLDSSQSLSQQMFMLSKKHNDSFNIAKAFSNLEGIAYEKGNFTLALSYIDSTSRYIQNNAGYLATNYSDKAELLMEMKRYPEAAAAADAALKYRLESKNPVYIAAVYELQSTIASLAGDYKTAYEKYKLAKNVSDSIRNTERTKQVAELEKKYSHAKNEKTIKELDQQKRIYSLIALAGILLVCLLAFFIRQLILRSKQKVIETEQRLNRARMNPHFFFNALSSLQTLALQNNDGKLIAGNLSKFSHIMRASLESTYQEYITIEEETVFLNEYLQLQQSRFPQKFSYAINAAAAIEPDEMLVPAMILQPFAENSIEHGFASIDYPGFISIFFEKKEKDLFVKITDNGNGLPGNAKEQTEHISRAIQIIKDRLYLLNRELKTKAAFTIDNRKDGKGVLVLIKLPVLYKGGIRN